MPVFTVGLNSMLTPFSFGNANPKLIFHWSVNKRDVPDLLPRHMEVFDKPLLFSPVFSTEGILISTNSQLKLYTKQWPSSI
ncbi:nuclear pore membrane glycoprotein 210-like [Rissa tridactyla]|uniref:nuclear pore membrane glycoprotein 210-like n=1 Tax=Rissa tridactyla TaxID=75485 RepID=UPI0023BAED3E|nr:nuclear pore membrane glycoprotein 210-like [Rissa tridactyla]